MLDYVRNILPRIQKYSKSLDIQELYIDKPCVLMDGDTNYHEYEFCRDGRLIMSVNGQVQLGRWEYRESTQRLLIERPTDAILLQSAFVDNALMVLKKSGSNDLAFLLVNRSEVPGLDYETYLMNYVDRKGLVYSENEHAAQEDHTEDQPQRPEISFTLFIYILLGVVVLFLLLAYFD